MPNPRRFRSADGLGPISAIVASGISAAKARGRLFRSSDSIACGGSLLGGQSLLAASGATSFDPALVTGESIVLVSSVRSTRLPWLILDYAASRARCTLGVLDSPRRFSQTMVSGSTSFVREDRPRLQPAGVSPRIASRGFPSLPMVAPAKPTGGIRVVWLSAEPASIAHAAFSTLAGGRWEECRDR